MNKLCTCGVHLNLKNTTYIGESTFKTKIVKYYNCNACKSTMVSVRKVCPEFSNRFGTSVLLESFGSGEYPRTHFCRKDLTRRRWHYLQRLSNLAKRLQNLF